MVWIRSVHAISLGPFRDTGVVEFSPTMNIVVGENNSGKSSLLSALIAPPPSSPHREPHAYLPGDVKPTSVVTTLRTDTFEIREIMARTQQTYHVMISQMGGAAQQTVTNFFARRQEFDIHAQRVPNTESVFVDPALVPWVAGHRADQWTRLKVAGGAIIAEGFSNGRQLPAIFDSAQNPPIFRFEPIRTPPSRCVYGENPVLSPSADNLPRVLAYIQNRNPDRYREIIRYMAEVLGSIENISVAPVGNECEIRLWPTSDQSDDLLSFPLSSSGTGVAQVLAILVAASSYYPSCIIVDEINSFLHPAAVKRLLSILRLYYPRHQYIISTHSADVIAHAVPDVVLFVTREGFNSHIEPIDREVRADLRRVAQNLGFSLTEVFGVDHVLWVEGETEEEIALLCYERNGPRLPPNCKIARVSDTGAFESRRTRDVIARVYKHVADELSPAVGTQQFVLDREKRSDDSVAAAERATDGRVLFLPRRMVECYLLNAEAIAEAVAPGSGHEVEAVRAGVEEYFREHGGDPRLDASGVWDGLLDTESWKAKVDAGKLISLAVAAATGDKVEYRKRVHGPQVFKRLLAENNQDALALCEFFTGIFSRVGFPIH